MTKRELILALIADYHGFVKTVRLMQKDGAGYNEVIEYLIKMKANRGICFYASITRPYDKQNFKFSDVAWIDDYATYYTYWFKTPWECNNVKDVINSLKFRLSILRKELKKTKP